MHCCVSLIDRFYSRFKAVKLKKRIDRIFLSGFCEVEKIIFAASDR